jgi:Multiubiquitin
MLNPNEESAQGAKPPKTVTILVNQDEHEVPKEKISYSEIVALYLSDGGTQSNEFLVKYSHGHSANVSGTLAPGNEVMVKDGMRFRISGTGES